MLPTPGVKRCLRVTDSDCAGCEHVRAHVAAVAATARASRLAAVPLPHKLLLRSYLALRKALPRSGATWHARFLVMRTGGRGPPVLSSSCRGRGSVCQSGSDLYFLAGVIASANGIAVPWQVRRHRLWRLSACRRTSRRRCMPHNSRRRRSWRAFARCCPQRPSPIGRRRRPSPRATRTSRCIQLLPVWARAQVLGWARCAWSRRRCRHPRSTRRRLEPARCRHGRVWT